MSLFLSTFCNKLDKKGRVSVPASFRAALTTQTFPGIVAFRSLESAAIEGFGIDVIEKLSQSVQGLSPVQDRSETWAHVIFAEAQQLPFDSEGRILLPPLLRDHAQIDENVTFVGRGPVFQIWNPTLFAQHQEEQRLRLIHNRTAPIPLHSIGGVS